MVELISGLGEATLQTLLICYCLGMVWTFLNWIRTIQEISSRAEMAANRRDRNLANALKQSARDTYSEGFWAVPAWPLVVVRNLRTVAKVRKDYKLRKKAQRK